MLVLIGLKKFRSFQKLNRIERGSVGLQELRRGIHASLPGSTRQDKLFFSFQSFSETLRGFQKPFSEFFRDFHHYWNVLETHFQRLSEIFRDSQNAFSEFFRDSENHFSELVNYVFRLGFYIARCCQTSTGSSAFGNFHFWAMLYDFTAPEGLQALPSPFLPMLLHKTIRIPKEPFSLSEPVAWNLEINVFCHYGPPCFVIAHELPKILPKKELVVTWTAKQHTFQKRNFQKKIQLL